MIKPLYAMIVILALFLAGSSYLVYSRNKIRPGKEVVERANIRLSSARAELARVEGLPKLPLLDPTWTKMRFFFEGCGISVQPLTGSDNPILYAGPATAWHAVLNGPPGAILACADVAASEYPIIFNSLDLNPSDSRLTISVLGQIRDIKLTR